MGKTFSVGRMNMMHVNLVFGVAHEYVFFLHGKVSCIAGPLIALYFQFALLTSFLNVIRIRVKNESLRTAFTIPSEATRAFAGAKLCNFYELRINQRRLVG